MTTQPPSLGRTGRLYVSVVTAIGVAVVAHSLSQLLVQEIPLGWFVLAGLTLLSGSFTIRIPSIPSRLSVSETFVFTAALLFGPAAATIIVVLDGLIISLWLRKSSRQPLRVLFNMAAPAISIWLATHAFFWLANTPQLSVQPQPIASLVAPLLAMALIFFLLNSWLIAIAIGFEKNVSPFRVWLNNYVWLSLNYFSGASVAALLLPYFPGDEGGFIRVASILLPLLLISYLTFKTALGRVEDANRHLAELNRLYLSTIETLAMAIDAKDQITHGHIRRVQQYAVALARKIGITDESQIRAIEAASLLHDMGKLAVPEYILNKPGKLTEAEFEKMKRHASAGADILSAIDFPYPVVPIVRHHHENWDGSGYPDGLKGTDIPIGARILSVVDCFDALTSDRPYRPRLPDSAAIRILTERRGTMYDPLIVDTFLAVYQDIAPSSVDVFDGTFASLSRDLGARTVAQHDSGLDDITASTEEMLVLFELARTLGITSHFEEAAEAIVQHVRRLVPLSTIVLYTHDAAADELQTAHVAGEHAAHFRGLKIPRGQRLTGWVAANRQTILNSDPVLDLGEPSRALRPRLRSCLSTPVVHGETLVGVLGAYSTDHNAFTENHRRVIEAVARQISSVFRQGVRPTHGPPPSELSDVRTTTYESEWSRDRSQQGNSLDFSIALVHYSSSPGSRREIDASFGGEIASVVRQALRSTDVLFRYGPGELVALLGHTTRDTTSHIRRRIAEQLAEYSRQRPQASLVFCVGTASAPSDGGSIDTLISAARGRASGSGDIRHDQESIH